MSRSVSHSSNAQLRIYLLGGLRVLVGARQLADGDWHLRKAATLVKLLALAHGHRLHREQLLEMLWPDLDPGAAANNLHRTLHAARRALDPSGITPSPYLGLQRDLVSLCPAAPLWVDAEAFESAATQAQRSRALDDYRA